MGDWSPVFVGAHPVGDWSPVFVGAHPVGDWMRTAISHHRPQGGLLQTVGHPGPSVCHPGTRDPSTPVGAEAPTYALQIHQPRRS